MNEKRWAEVSLGERAEAALKKAVAKAIADHKQTGDPIAVWRDGKVMWISAEDIVLRETEAEYKLLKKTNQND